MVTIIIISLFVKIVCRLMKENTKRVKYCTKNNVLPISIIHVHSSEKEVCDK